MFRRARLAFPLAAVIPFLSAGCDVSGLAGGLTGDSNPFLPDSTGPSIAVTPGDQDIDDQDYAFLYASTNNLPEPSTDNDGIHGAARVRWTIVSGTGGLNLADPNSSPMLNNATTLDTDPATDFGGAVLYFPDLGTSGEVVVKAELIRPTDRTVINEFGEAMQEHEDIVIATSQAVIHVNDELRLKLTPPVTTLPAGGKVSLKAILEALQSAGEVPNLPGEEPDAGDADLNIRYEWNMTGPAGAGDLQSSPESDTAEFTAFSESATFTVTVKAIETLEDGSERVNGPASATVKVDPRLRTVNTFGYYLSRNESMDPASAHVVAWVYFPKIEGAISYRIVGQGMHDNAYYGTSWGMSVAIPLPAGGSVEDTGSEYRVGLSAASGSITNLGASFAWMDSRFSGMRVIVTATVAD